MQVMTHYDWDVLKGKRERIPFPPERNSPWSSGDALRLRRLPMSAWPRYTRAQLLGVSWLICG